MRYVPYLIAKNPDGTYAIVFNPGAPTHLGAILRGDMSIHSPYGTINAAKERAESFGKNGGFIALNVDIVPAAKHALAQLDYIIMNGVYDDEELPIAACELLDTLPSGDLDDRG